MEVYLVADLECDLTVFHPYLTERGLLVIPDGGWGWGQITARAAGE